MPTYTVQCKVCDTQQNVFRNLSEFGKWPKHCRKKMRQIIGRTHIMKDIEPYRAVAADVKDGRFPVIGSRARHKTFLRDNGYEEAGNTPPKEQGYIGDKLPSVREEVIKNLKIVTGRPA